MTKKQVAATPRTRLDPGTVVRAALKLLDEKGAEAVSVRGVADQLGVRMNTVLWHTKTKARLSELMADAIIGAVALDELPDAAEPRARELAHRYRRALLAHRDGAAVVAGTYAPEPATLDFAEAMVEALLRMGLDDRAAVWTCWTLVYFILGLAQEEQELASILRSGRDDPARTDAARRRFTQALSATAHPTLNRVARHFTDPSFDERFSYGLSLILRAPGA